MHLFCNSTGPDLFRYLMIVWLSVLTSSCTFNITRYTDGPLTQYLSEPIPQINQPIARTLSLEKVMFQTAASLKATMISDMVAREIYFMPEDLGRNVKSILNLDKEYSKDSTYQALNLIARNRAEARQMWSGTTSQTVSSGLVNRQPAKAYIQRQENRAKEAYNKGDYLAGDIHNSAAMNAMKIDQSFSQAQASVDLTFGVLNSLAAAGEALIKNEFIKLRNWIEFESGAIGNKAPEGSHLSVFFLQFFDAKSFQLDSRNRVAVFLVLTDINGRSTSILEGSDILNCEGECNLFQPKPSARLFEQEAHSADVQQQLWTPEGVQYLIDNGFDTLSGIYQYLLVQHGLQKLTAAQ